MDYSHFSNGEKQILVMSLYWAIMNQSHNELPFIIDTPFARIDTEHRANITERFFKELPGQLFVLYKCLMELQENRHLSDEEYFPTYVKAHLDRGARLLEQEKKYSRDLLVHLTELDDSL